MEIYSAGRSQVMTKCDYLYYIVSYIRMKHVDSSQTRVGLQGQKNESLQHVNIRNIYEKETVRETVQNGHPKFRETVIPCRLLLLLVGLYTGKLIFNARSFHHGNRSILM